MSENRGTYPDRAGQRYGRFGNSTQRPNSRRLLGLRFYALLDGLYRLGRPLGQSLLRTKDGTMSSARTRLLLVAATLVSGILAGGVVDRVVVQ